MKFSHSRVDTFCKCAYKFKLRYIDEVKTIPAYEADNPLIVGTALHTGIEKDVKTAIAEYYANYPIITDKHIEEVMKLEAVIPMCKEILPDGIFEKKIEAENFQGFMDLLVPISKGVYDLYDFKYSNNVKNYMESGQLHEYKYFFEKMTGEKIRKMFFLFAPKVSIRMKKTETPETFRMRLRAELKTVKPQLIEIDYNPEKVEEFKKNVMRCMTEKKFEKTPTQLCAWCEYQKYCEIGDNTDMELPKNERREINADSNKKIWLYGLPFSGKTYLANRFPDVLMLNTDGNVKYIDAPCVSIKDELITNGRISTRKFAWEKLKETITELEKEQNDFKTVVVDLLEDCYEHCRLWCYDHLGIEHESDNSFKAWDFVRTEFLATIKRLANLNYNVIFISHEDSSKDITKKTGDKITAIKPNITDKVALKIAGMVDIVGRVINDSGERIISFKSNEVIFGGGRLELKALDVPCTYEDLISIYPNATTTKKIVAKKEKVEVIEIPEVENKEIETPENLERVSRSRKNRVGE